ncbi:MAG: hypothetical protein GX130_05105 [Candidatus Hydrogenedens sp.]|jgi:hypothetical protein|nr:hypothetical protein [Candidatus Hydrogenedens sp.]
MRRGLLSFLLPALLLLLEACSAPAPEQPAGDDMAAEAVSKEGLLDTGMVMEGINLYMHRPDEQEGVPSRPELWVQAESFTIGEDKVYAFTEATAVLYGKGEEDPITLHAMRGVFKQDHYAKMDGDIQMRAGTMKMFLLELQWDRPAEGATAVVHSDQSVIIDDPDLQLTASSMRLFPDMKEFEMDNVTGVVRFGKDMS